MKKLIIALCLLLALPVSAFAMETPTGVTVQNLNGSQQLIKTYTVPPGTDPETLKEEPFDYEGFTYTFATIVKQENECAEQKQHTETVTVSTAKNDLSVILAELAPTLEYDDGQYSGVLSLDHTTLSTQAAGYATRSYTVTVTRELGSLPSNDISYIPATTVKDGKTLSLAGVDWQVQATALVDGSLVPSQYRAVATYSSPASYSAATGYITTANYVGEVSREEVESITYTLTYLGCEMELEPPEVTGFTLPATVAAHPILSVCIAAGTAALIALAVLLILSRREIRRLRELEEDQDQTPEETEYESVEEEQT